MRFKSAVIKDFKRFTHLTVQGIPESARLIMLAGPNGSGKSSFLDALRTWHGWTSRKERAWEPDYHVKAGSSEENQWRNQVMLEFHTPLLVPKKVLHIRSAYRNDPDFQITELRKQGNPLDGVPSRRMIDNDATVRLNYQRIASQGLEDLYGTASDQMTLAEYRKQSIGDIREAFLRLFPDLELHTLGNPLEDGTFRFTKGRSKGFSFKNLSGGEKAAFDLVLDLIVARRTYDDTMFGIDEPESHMNARLQAELLSVLYELIPESCQLMLATHSLGMMRRARDLESSDPGSVVFLDFEDRDFDEVQVIEPTIPDVEFWHRAYDVALADLAALIAPERVVICEGNPAPIARSNQAHDARIYECIFRAVFPATRFVPGGND